MNTVEKTRVEIYVPFKAIKGYEEQLFNVIEASSWRFGGCTIIENNRGYYKELDPGSDKGFDVLLDRINIIIFDVTSPLIDVEKHIKVFIDHLNKLLKEQIIYYCYYKVMGPDLRELE